MTAIIAILAGLLPLWLAPNVAAATTSCAFSHRQIVRIRGTGDDPSSFLWVLGPDRVSGLRALRDYQSGQGSDDFIFFHTRVLEQDTRGIVTAACPGSDTRIIGVRILSGFHKGADGFVDVMNAAYPPK